VLKSVLDGSKKKNKAALRSLRSRFFIWTGLALTLLLSILFGIRNYDHLRGWLFPSTHQKVHPEAQEAYLKGRYLLDRFDGQAYAFFEQATIKNPEFANAYAGLADSCVLISIWDNFNFEQREVYIKAKESALRALELDEFSAEAHTSLANVYFFYEWDFQKAEKEWHRAFKLNNGYRLAHETYAFYLAAIGRSEEAWQQMEIILKNDALSAKANAEAGFILYLQKNFNESIKYYKKAYELDPGYMWGRDKLIEIYVMQGRHKEAFQEEVKQLRLRNDIPPNEVNEKARSYKAGGIYEIFRSEVESLILYTPPASFSMACDYAMLNEKEKAIEWLQRMYQDRHGGLVFIKVDPVFENLHDNPLFQDIVQRMNFPK
jgi:tetratricopeptide (TPR) repeat protein